MRAIGLFIIASGLAGAVRPAAAQDPVKLSPHLYTVVFENDQVRVLEFRAQTGVKEPMHSHPAAVVHVLTAGKARFTTPDGKSQESESTAGMVIWSDPVTHAYEYLGPGEARVLIIELKGAPAPKPDGEARHEGR